MKRGGWAYAAIGVLGYLPAPVLAVKGYLCGLLALLFFKRRRRIVLTNLRLCFPERGRLWRGWLLLVHFALLGRFVFDHALLLAMSERRLGRLVRIKGMEHLPPAGTPTILLAPHLLGLDVGGTWALVKLGAFGVYAPQSSAFANELLLRARTMGDPGKASNHLYPFRDSMKRVFDQLKDGRCFYYLMDMDFRDKAKHVFVPFLGMPDAATVTTLSRLARLSGAQVMGCTTRMRPWGGYEVSISAPWENFPCGDEEADARRFNEFVADEVRRSPAQYYWVHRRFKTRPAGRPDVYAQV